MPEDTYRLSYTGQQIDQAIGSTFYLTTAPSSANTGGTLKVVVLSAEPATRYEGYLYIITGSN